jgi:phage baseplate assembly protein gpV
MEKLEIVEIIRKIVENEVRKLYIAEIGVVTSVFPHSSDSDKNNYECNVNLKYRDLELRKVPVATQHIGLANIPHVGDLVLITFINGNINAPVVIGRLYNDEDRPPLSKEEEIVYIPPYSENSDLKRVHMEFPGGMALSVKDNVATIESNTTKLTLERDGNVQIESDRSIVFSASSIKMKGKKSIELESEAGTMSFKSLGKTEIHSQRGLSLATDIDLDIIGRAIDIKSRTSLNMKGSARTSVESDGTVFVESNGAVSIKGLPVSIN